MRLVFRPLGAWTDPVTSPRRSHNFRATWTDTLDLLDREVRALGCTSEVVLQVDADERAMRLDGGIRADAKVQYDGIVLSFTSRFGPLRYACDTYTAVSWQRLDGWQANVRAVALGLQALRAVERYGIGMRGEQYQGWAQLGQSTIALGERTLTPEEAARLLLDGADEPTAGWQMLVGTSEAVRVNVVEIWRRAAKLHHPDQGGDATVFRRLMNARDLLLR